VSVSDCGPGVAPEDRARVFERFWRGRGERQVGAGLGLAIVAEIARAHGGTVEVGDAPGGGALFVLKLRHAWPRACSCRAECGPHGRAVALPLNPTEKGRV
jgi:signal transduction histidine kinase